MTSLESAHGEATSFAELLRHHRLNQHLTQEELADMAGLSVRAVRNAELGQVTCPRRDSINRLADALRLNEHAMRQLHEAAHTRRTHPLPQNWKRKSEAIYSGPSTGLTVVVYQDENNLIDVHGVDVERTVAHGRPVILLTLITDHP
ncbi:helix-turn-helix transcriptional regulator [Actinoplanes sp. NPDC051633]|uniref:helix-turn-helix domain-containing protein n=1 Tax=Actinoplanes sp. NPDC051633 TaxID=3155670 RepID=UPI003442A767